MPIGVPRIIYCWGEELPAQWTDIYNFIFRRRMVFLMQYLDDELCNQICGLLINIHMEDRSKELEKKEMEKSGLFKSTKTKSTSTIKKENNVSSGNTTNKKQSVEDLLTSDRDFGIDDNHMLEQYTLQKITTEWLNWNAQFFDYSDEPYLYYLADILNKDFSKDNQNLKYNLNANSPFNTKYPNTSEMTNLIKQLKNIKNISGAKEADAVKTNLDVYSPFRLLANFAPQNYNFEKLNGNIHNKINPSSDIYSVFKNSSINGVGRQEKLIRNNSQNNFSEYLQNSDKLVSSSEKALGQRSLKQSYAQERFGKNLKFNTNQLKAYNYLDPNTLNNESGRTLYRKQTERVMQEEESKKVFMIINSFGGSVGNGITVHDALQFIKAGSLTLALGVAASAASLALAGGTIGERYVTEGCHTMIHQPECLTPDHDVLTDKGWVNIADVTLEHKVAVLKSGNLCYEHPIKVHKYEYNGELYCLKTTGIDLKVTTNHKMFVNLTKTYKPLGNYDFSLVESSQLVGKFARYKKDANWEVPNYQFILPPVTYLARAKRGPEEQPPVVVPMEPWLIFFGFWVAEGCTASCGPDRTDYRVRITQKKPQHCHTIEAVITALGYNFIKDQHENGSWHYDIYNKQLWTYLDPLSTGALNKRLPDWVWSLSREQCNILLDALISGDGHVNINDGTRHYFTGSIGLAEDVTRLILHAGYGFSYSQETQPSRASRLLPKDKNGFAAQVAENNPLYRVNVLKRTNPCANYQGRVHDQLVPYQGPVHCLTVSSGVFYVKRNGNAVWTGNSGLNGQASDIWIDSQEIMKIRLDVAEIYSLSTYRPRHKILRDLDRDFYLTAMETIYYGLADEIATNDVMHDIIEMTSKVWDYHDSKQQRLLETRDSQTAGFDTQTQN
jgi:ATP-dependent protease ClpP protease subunit